MLLKKFRFGTGISSYQVEGAYKEDGKEESIWDAFTHEKGNVLDGTNGDVALDFYHRYREDLDLAKELGIQDFRFSLSWTRVIKEDGTPNPEGIRFYQSLIEEIKKRNRNPVRTIYHWDRPRWFLEKGAFLPRTCLDDFSKYRDIVSECFAPLRTDFISFNEPQCFLFLGFHKGGHAPNVLRNYLDLCQRAHHVLLCHAIAFEKIKAKNPLADVAFVNTFSASIPRRDDDVLLDKRKKSFFAYPKKAEDFYTVSIYGDPLYLGKYPNGYLESLPDTSFVHPGDIERIFRAKPKTCDCNIYTGRYYDLNPEGNLFEVRKESKKEQSDLAWLKKRPSSVYYGPLFRYDRYHLPIRITENGGCYKDSLKKGLVHDKDRVSYLKEYLSRVDKANQDGIPIVAYYYWSLLDNFEWAEGYSKRFGLVYIDYDNGLKRIKKDSFYAYQKIIEDTKKQ